MEYDKNKYYSVAFIKQGSKNMPAYMREEIKKLIPEKVKNDKGVEYIGAKISERLFAYLFNKRW